VGEISRRLKVFRPSGVLLMMISTIFSIGALAKEFPLEIIERFADARIVIYTRQSAIDAAPAWNPSQGAPPLSIEALIKAVEKWSAAEPQPATAFIRKIELKPIRHEENRNRWYYLVQLDVKEQGRSSTRYLAVLMSGKILPAIREPEPYK
jgi:hypothetical protein